MFVSVVDIYSNSSRMDSESFTFSVSGRVGCLGLFAVPTSVISSSDLSLHSTHYSLLRT